MPLRLIVLGGLRCTHNGHELDWLRAKQLSAALLVYVTVERRVTREHVLAMFWPECDPLKAGRRLNQTLYSLRKALGSDCIQTNGAELIAGERLQCDANEFEQLVALGRNADATALYRGPFLAGVHIAARIDFDSWVDSWRARCARGFRNACRASVEERLGAGDLDGAMVAARQWVIPDPFDDEAQHRLIELLALSGKRAEALAQYEFYERILQRDDLKPLDHTVELVARIRAGEIGTSRVHDALATGLDGPSSFEPAGPERPHQSPAPPSRAKPRAPRSAWRRMRLLLPFGLLLLSLGAVIAARRGWAVAWPPWTGVNSATIDPGLVAVVPFRVRGAEPSLSFLGQGMMDLIAAKLTGEIGPRAVDPRIVSGAVGKLGGDDKELTGDEALVLARDLGAGLLVLGEVVSLPGRVALTATLHDVATERRYVPVSVDGSPDSVASLVDRLVAGLLAIDAGEPGRLASLTTTSLPALRLYLEGQLAYRGGRPDEALSHFTQAIELDSTFALAGLMWWRARARVGGPGRPDLFALAWRHRHRLAERDRTFLEALLGPNYPRYYSDADRTAALHLLVQRQPDNPDAWFGLGNQLPHMGQILGISDTIALRRAAHAFSRTLELDSTHLLALESLSSVALVLGDTAAGRGYSERYLARVATGLEAETVRCRFAATSRGVAALAEILARIDSVGYDLANRCLRWFHGLPAASEVRDSLANTLRRRFDQNPELMASSGWTLLGWTLYRVASDRGRPAEATRYLRDLRRIGQLDSLGFLVARVSDGLYWDGDSSEAARAAAEMAAQLARDPVKPEYPYVDALWALGKWRLAHGDTTGVRSIIEHFLAFAGAGESFEQAVSLLCAQTLRAWHAELARSPDSPVQIARLDSLLRTFGARLNRLHPTSNLILASLLERRGDYRDAQRVLGAFQIGSLGAYGSTVLRERARIAVLLGDTAGAIRAYRRYLAMRTDPEPEVAPAVANVRAELARLTQLSHSARAP